MPGNRCHAGLDLEPKIVSCSAFGGWFNLKNAIIFVIIIVALYFGWPIIEAILIMLPIPDPKDIKEKVSGLVSKGQAAIKKP